MTVAGDDVTVKRATSAHVGNDKVHRLYQHAIRTGTPFVYFGECGGGRIPDILGANGFTRVTGYYELTQRRRRVPLVLAIVAGATVFGHFLQVTNVPADLASWMAGLPLPPWGIILAVIFFYLVAGMFLDALALVMLTIPIFYPVVVGLGYDPIWFGVIIVLVTQMGVITPPVGVNVYVVSGMDRGVSLQDVFKGALPFLAALIAAALLLVAFPGIATAPAGWVK